ncbi:MAG: AMP-binding protein [Acidobacteria bacterium]|nr:AMP-binding protein [Acidobacteriota bacterium]
MKLEKAVQQNNNKNANPKTLIDCLIFHGETRPDKIHARYIFKDRENVFLTFAQTLERTREFAVGYAAFGVRKGDVVLIIMEHHEDLMAAFLGAIWIGAIPCFLPPTNPKTVYKRYYENLKNLIQAAKPKAVLSHSAVRDALADSLHFPDPPVLLVVEDVVSHGLSPNPADQDPEDIALIQYSSGSTGLQKGVCLSHRAILAEISGVSEFFEISHNDRLLTWVPLYHDWGLVCVALHALVEGMEYSLLSPIEWVQNPVSAWQVANLYKSTIFYQPNFAFNLMAKRIREDDMKEIDLSSIRLVCNGAEPCFYESHKMFIERFSKYGLRNDYLGIVYGMAEITNSVIAAGHKEPIIVDNVDRFILQAERYAKSVDESSPNLQRFLGVGRGLKNTKFKIVDENRQELPERYVGEVAIHSDARMHYYHRNKKATEQSLTPDGWYYTGDMGYRVGNILFITGRRSDMIIVGGVNIFPQDIENIVAEHPAAVPGRIAAVGVDDLEQGTQQIVLIVESKSNDKSVLADLAKFARKEVKQNLNVIINRVVHVPHMWLIKTSSGKIARIPNYKRLQELEVSDKIPSI